MEIYNPLCELNWIIGKWQGFNQYNSEKRNVKLISSKYGDETIKLTFIEADENKVKIFEEMFLLYDKTHRSFFLKNFSQA